MGLRRWLFHSVVVALLVAACGGAPPSEPPFSPTGPIEPLVQCLGIVNAKCREIVAGVEPNGAHAPPARIRITCVTAPCDDRNGEVTIEVVYADGSRDSQGQAWMAAEGAGVAPAGPPAPARPLPVQPVCVGIARQPCLDAARDAVDAVGPGAVVQSISVNCIERCTDARGDGTVRIVLADGSVQETQFGYESAVGG